MRIGTVCYSTEQGIGILPKQFYDEGVITDVVIMHHSHRRNHPEWFPGAPTVASRPLAHPECVQKMVSEVDALFFVETPFDWMFLEYCRSQGKRTYIMPMYECTPRNLPAKPDKWLCPSLLDCDYFPGSPFIPVPVPRNIQWEQRHKAVNFLHNGGNLGLRGHKGTLEILKAMAYVKSPIKLTVRAQDERGFAEILNQVPQCRSDSRIVFEGPQPYSRLFTGHDVFIMAEKYNGLSLPLAEARAAGLVVMTSNRYPMNTWLTPEYLIPVERYTRACISGAYLEYDEAVIDPRTIAETIDRVYMTDIQDESLRGFQWSMANSWDNLKPIWKEALST